MKKQIVNIINFIRGTEPRFPVELLSTMKNQMAELKRLGLPATFLFQYDALSDANFMEAAKEYAELFEFGVWLELTRGCVERAGQKWRGRNQEWDWQVDICYIFGYPRDAREKLTDAAMDKFKEVFGYYPKSAGAWALDAVTLAHLEKKYHISAACVCRDQWGTDHSTFWGGYYGQGYYPSKNNAFVPAQTASAQIGIPVFRMLGSDPIYQYDAGLNLTDGPAKMQPVITLEPVYIGNDQPWGVKEGGGGGGVPSWVDWYFKENFNGKCLSFGYAQAGQENSFGWESLEGQNGMKDGFLYQMSKIKTLCGEGKIEAMTLREAGEWYKGNYKLTPPSAITAESDWKNEGRKSYWYCCKRYRANLYFEGGMFWLRDFFLFDEKYPERYRDKACSADGFIFDTLPVVDGNRFSGNGTRAGLYPCYLMGKEIKAAGTPVWKEIDGAAVVTVPAERFGNVTFTFSEECLSVSVQKNDGDFILIARVPEVSLGALKFTADIKNCKTIGFTYNQYSYALSLHSGTVSRDRRNKIIVRAENGVIAAKI